MKTKRLIRVITLLLTTVALVAGQNVWATTKTVTYTITNSIEIGQGNTDYRVTITRSGDVPFDNSGPNYTVDMSQSSLSATNGSNGDYTFTLADGFKLQMSWGTGTNVIIRKRTDGDVFYIGPVYDANNKKNIIYHLSCVNAYYYVTHVTIRGLEGQNFDHSYDSMWNFDLSEAKRYSLGQVIITYSDVPALSIFESGGTNTYKIKDKHDLRHLANYVNNGGNGCSGMTFRQTQHITCNNSYVPIGNSNNGFCGTYDGQGNTISGITVNRPANSYIGLFGHIGDGGTVENVVLAGSSFIGNSHVGGIAGRNGGTIRDCLFTGTTIEATINKGAVSGSSGSNATYTNNYYTNINLSGVNGSDVDGARLARTVTLDGNVVLVGDVTSYTSGFATIGTGNYAMRYNNTLYSGATQTLTLSYTGLADGYTAFYSVNGSPIDGNTFQMPAENVTIGSAGNFRTIYVTNWQAGPLHDGSSAAKPYLITTPAGLQLLATETNGGEHFSDSYFKLDSDIDMSRVANFTPIGQDATNYFGGIFDGEYTQKDKDNKDVAKEHIISGLTVNQQSSPYAGLFGYLNGAVVSQVTLEKANIQGGSYVGGIAGYFNGGTISNCHIVCSTFSASDVNDIAGAIVGQVVGNNCTLTDNTYHSTIIYGNSPYPQGIHSEGDAFNIGIGKQGSDKFGDVIGASLDATQLFVNEGRTDLTVLFEAYHNPVNHTAHCGTAPDLRHLLATVRGNVTIPSGSVFEAEYVNVLTGSHLTLEDGAELIFRDERSYAPVILEKKVAPYTDGNNGWNLLVTPFQEGVSLNGLSGYNPTTPAVYDLYQMSDDRTVWENSKKKSLDKTNVYNSDGILYASSVETTLKNRWEQKSYPETAEGHKVYLKKSCWNVIGNPYTFTAYVNRPYYRMNADGSALELVTEYWKNPVPVCGGIVMKAFDEVVHIDDSVYFTRQAPPVPVSITDDRTVKAPLPIVLPASHGVEDDLRFIYVLEEYYDNVDRIAENAGQSRFFQLRGRTLWKDGCWNTLCLPFPLSAEQIAASKLAGADIRKLSSSSYNSSTKRLTLNFTAVTSIQAGVPYIIKWTSPEPYVAYNGSNGEACSDIVSPDFPGVTVSSTYTDAAAIATSLNDTRTQTTYVDFIGTYTPAQLPEDHTKLLVGIENKLYWPQSDARIYAQRAYFQLKNGLTADNVQNASMFFDDGETTEIRTTDFTNYTDYNDAWYTLDGRKIVHGTSSNGKLPKGVYIHNGRKVVVK